MRARVVTVRRIGSGGVALLVGALLVALGGCGGGGGSSDGSVVVVSTDYPFGSLNAATAAGRTPGSTLVRGLVQSGFTRIDATGAVVADASFGSVEKVSDAPLTVRYTIADGVTWSDGVPVTPADLLLEWAARSGQLDEIVPVVGGDGTAPLPPDADESVVFGAASPALVHVQAVPTVEGQSLTLVYSTPVADWPTALDVNVPAHVVGRLALDGGGGTDATPGPSPEQTPEPSPTTAVDWADAVAAAITSVDRDSLVAISRQWRAYGTRASLVADPTLAVTTGPYRVARVTDERTELVLDEHYTGERPGSVPTVVVRNDLDPLAQVRAVRSGSVDVALPMSTADVRDAADHSSLTARTGSGAVLQLWLGEQPTSPFSGDDGAARRSAFVGALGRAALANVAGAPAADVVLPQVGPDWVPPEPQESADPSENPPGDGQGEDQAPDQAENPADDQVDSSTAGDQADGEAADAAADDPAAEPTAPAARVPVRLLVDTADPVRAALAEAITDQVAPAGFDVTLVTEDTTVALWSQPGRWDVVLLPVTQAPLPVSAVVARWRTGGLADVTEHSDGELDALLDAVAAQTDPAAAASTLATVATALTASDVVVPLVRQPVMSVVRSNDPRLTAVRPPDWSATDQTAWWTWLP